jgi:type I restriction enzyme, S subunit
MSQVQQLLTEHLDIWTAADTEKKSGRGRGGANAGKMYGIQKLRGLILELAVRGKLVPQDPTDEPASELLKRIQAKKAKLIAEGKLKKEKPLVPIADDEKPFELPKGWEWVRLSEIAEANTGYAFKSSEYTTEGTLVLRVTNINPDSSINPEDAKFISAESANSEYKNFQLAEGDVLLVMVGGSLGKIGVVDKACLPAVLNQNMWKLSYASLIESKYFIHGLKFINNNQIVITESTHGHLAQGEYLSKLFPLAPISEQHRIVAKVDELMVLCDQLEQQHSNAAEAHEQLVEHLLGTLTQAQNAQEFNSQWQRIHAHFDTLFTTEASIDALKQTLLQLAVMGKLVPQDLNDEPASELLKRIQAEKAKLIAEGKLKKEKPLAPINDEHKPFELALGWCWARFPELGEFARGKSKHRPRNDPSLFNPPIYPLVQTGEVARSEYLIKEYHSKYSELGLEQSRMWKQGTLCITIAANIADSAILGFDACFPDSVVGFSASELIGDTKYYLYFMKTAREDLLKFAPATAQKNINLEILESVLIPLPPLAEQHRIVARVDELMALCDQLKTRIQQASKHQQQLADELVAKAVA